MSGKKTVETRSYPIPQKYIGQPLALIETPGPRGKREAGIEHARIIGIVTFSRSFEYKTKRHWLQDVARHCVKGDDPQFQYQLGKPKWGWEIGRVQPIVPAVDAPLKKGIVFAKSCIIPA
jgi:hypothetical protein